MTNTTRMSAFAALFLLVCMSAPPVNSRIPAYPSGSYQTNNDWLSLNPQGEEFSVSFPSPPAVYSSWVTYSDFLSRLIGKNSRVYVASDEGVVYLVMLFNGYEGDKGKPDKVMETLIKEIRNDFARGSLGSRVEIIFERDLTLNNLRGKQYRVSVHDVPGTIRCYVAKDRIYLLEAMGKDQSNSSIQGFFSSFMPGPLVSASAATIPKPATQDTQPDQATDKIFGTRDVDRKALIVLRPEAQYPDQAKQRGVHGVVAVRAVLSASGKVTNPEVVRGLPQGLSEAAIQATREMKFVPAVKNGQPASVRIGVEYSFSAP